MPNKYEILFQLAGQVSKQFSSSFKSAENSIRDLEIRIAQYQAKASKLGDLIALRNENKKLSDQYAEQREKLSRLNKVIKSAEAPSKSLLAYQKRVKKALLETKSAMDANGSSIKSLNKELGAQNLSVGQLTKKYDRLTKATLKAKAAQKQQLRISQINQKLESLSQAKNTTNTSIATSLVAMSTLGHQLVGVLSAPVRSAMKMEDAMADINKVIDFKDPDGLNKLKRQLEKISLEIPMTSVGLAQIAASAAQAGVAENELKDFAVDAARMGVAFDISAEQAGEMMAKWRSGMALTQGQTVLLADAVNALSNSNAALGSQIGEVLMRYGALGKVAGLTEGQTAALGATLIASGVQAEVAATGIQSMMRALTRGSSMSKLASKAFSKIGFDPKQLQKDVQEDAPAAIIKVLKTIQDKVPKELQMEYLTAMFGDEGARSMGPMLSNLEGLSENFARVASESDYAGSMLQEFISRAGTTSNALTLASNAITYISSAIGDIFLGDVKEGAIGFVQYAKAIGEWVRNNNEAVITITKIVGGFVGLIAGYHALRIAMLATVSPFLTFWTLGLQVKKLYIDLIKTGKLARFAMIAWKVACTATSLTMSGLTKAIQLIGIAMKFTFITTAKTAMFTWKAACLVISTSINAVTTAVKLMGIALKFAFTNPVGLAITAVAALVAAGVWLYKNWDLVKEKMAAAWQYIADMAKDPINTVIGWINKLIELLNKVKLPKWLGGGGFNIPTIPQLANGGIATGASLAMVGEGSEPEAILPLSRLSSMLGEPRSSNSTSVSVNFAPVINIGGGSGNGYEDVRRGLRVGSENLKREIERLLADERRLAY